MPLYINQEVIIVNNQSENVIFLFDRKNRIKSIINEDMFEIKDLLYEIKNEIKNIEMNKGFNGS